MHVYQNNRAMIEEALILTVILIYIHAWVSQLVLSLLMCGLKVCKHI